jgi:membrane protein required for colicin V production
MLTWADIALLAILGISTLMGLWRGFVVEVMSLAVWVAAFWVAFAFGDDVAALFEGSVQAPSARLFLGYAALFVFALMVGGLTTWLLGRLVKSTGLSGTDRMLGLGFGLLRGAALACVLVLVLGFTPAPQDPWWRESRLVPSFQRGAEWLRTWLPDAVARHIRFDPLLAALPALSPPDPEAGDNSAEAKAESSSSRQFQ